MHCITLHNTAKYCTTLQHTATHCNTLHHKVPHCTTMHHIAPQCTTLHQTAPHFTTLRHTASHCNTLHHTPTHCTMLQHKRPTHILTYYSTSIVSSSVTHLLVCPYRDLTAGPLKTTVGQLKIQKKNSQEQTYKSGSELRFTDL